MNKDDQIVASWMTNASPWIGVVRDDQIESRVVATNQAIVDAVVQCTPRTVLDVGCGEGWLVRALTSRGIQAMGVDVVPELIDAAQRAGGGSFQALSYADLAQGKLNESVDAVVCNFALFGKESVETLFAVIPSLLNPGGVFIMQTLHPLMACGEGRYEDGWRKGSWAGFSSAFTDPAPWYFRTLASWVDLFRGHSFCIRAMHEPLHPATGKPASVVFIAELLLEESV